MRRLLAAILATAGLWTACLAGPLPPGINPNDFILNKSTPQAGKTFSVSSATITDLYYSNMHPPVSGGGSSVYPATSTASFPYGMDASTITVQSITWPDGTVQVSSPTAGGGPSLWTETNPQSAATQYLIPSNPDRLIIDTSGSYVDDTTSALQVNGAVNFNDPSLTYGGINITSNGANVQIGSGASAGGNHSFALGYYASAAGVYSTALGYGASAAGVYSNALGLDASANGNSSTAIGSFASASGNYSTELGSGAYANGNSSTAIGSFASAGGDYSTALGSGASANGNRSTALGYGASATGYVSTAFGPGAYAPGIYSTAFGYGANAIYSNSTVIGADQSFSGNLNDNNAIGGITLGGYNPTTANGENWLMIIPGTTANTPRVLIGASTADDGSSALQVNGPATFQGPPISDPSSEFISYGTAWMGSSDGAYGIAYQAEWMGWPNPYQVNLTGINNAQSAYNDIELESGNFPQLHLFTSGNVAIQSRTDNGSALQVNGDMKVDDGDKVYFSNTTLTYFTYNSGTGNVELWKNGSLVQTW